MRASFSRLVASRSAWRSEPFTYGSAIVKRLSPLFAASAVRHDTSVVIDQSIAEAQHAAYVDALRTVIPQVIELPADPDSPDCCFIEDTAVVVGDVALITRTGAESRRGELASTALALQGQGLQVVHVAVPARLDGGDVLFTGREFFVGLSSRTNSAGVAAVAAAFPGIPVTPVPMLDLLEQ